MFKKVVITFAGQWVLKHRNDEVLPIDAVINGLKGALGGTVRVDKKSYTFAELTVASDDIGMTELEKKVFDVILTGFDKSEITGNFDIKVSELDSDGRRRPSPRAEDRFDPNVPVTPTANEAPPEESGSESEDKPEGEEEPVEDTEPVEVEPTDEKVERERDEQDEREDIGGTLARLFGKPDESKPKPPESADEIYAEIKSGVGGDEYKALADEIVRIAPEIVKNKLFDIFSYRCYLFSINDGYGLSRYLDDLKRLISALGLKSFDGRAVDEVRLSPVKESLEPFEGALRSLRRTGSSRVICIDISEWMNATENRFFKEFLRVAEKAASDNIIVFRIPFVEKDVCEKIKQSLGDLLYVHTVSFPPLSSDDVRDCAKDELGKYGFKMSPSAWKYFHERISEEKSDGKFYGPDTVKKVVRELLYKKQLDNAIKQKTDFVINKKDAMSICAVYDPATKSGYEMLDELVGCEGVKNRITEIVTHIEYAMRNGGDERPCIHMRFVGNPGTGKTTVARIVGKILKEKGVLGVGGFFEYSGRDFCGRYVGETAPKTSSMCRDAYGSVLFIDEAYSLYRGNDTDADYGREALDTLIAEMENHRNDFVVIMAGYTDDMEKLMKGNIGLASRMPYTIEFPNFTRDQLYEIFVSMLNKTDHDEGILGAARVYFTDLPDALLNSKEFSNARFVRNLFERTQAKAALRCQLEKKAHASLTKDDFERSSSEKEFTNLIKKKTRIGF